jgi:hypothetical protein
MLKAGIRALALAAALGAARPALAQAQEAEPARAGSNPRTASENAFNPAVSLILSGIYSDLSRSPADFRIDGFVPTLGEVEPFPRGFSLGESELTLAANIDPYFRGTGIFSVSPQNDVTTEEAYVQTLGLSNGFTAKAGRSLSGVGYLNQIHAHAWDFTDAPLANKVFLGGQQSDDGVQARWVAPLDAYLDFGLELGRGRGFPAAAPEGASRDKNGVGAANAFTHIGGDFGTGFAWQTGLSYLRTSPRDRRFQDVDAAGTAVSDSFSGRSGLWVLSGVLKWSPNYDPTGTNFKLQGEYFRRKENGDITFDTQAVSSGPRVASFSSSQSGWYLQGVYQFMPRWRAGYRRDQLDAGTTTFGGAAGAGEFPILSHYDPKRNTVMVDWSPSEFSRLRLQLARDESRRDRADNQLFLQYLVSLGAHGAHTF